MADVEKLEQRIGLLESRVKGFKLADVASDKLKVLEAFSSGDCTNGCTGGCTNGCTGGCTGTCASEVGQFKEEVI